LRSPLWPLVTQDRDAVADGFRLGQLQRPLLLALREEALAGAEEDADPVSSVSFYTDDEREGAKSTWLRPYLSVGSKPIRGKWLRVDAPEWEPLLNFAPDHVVDFMWMGTVQLVDGTRLQAYKHHWTRRYLHLSEDGRAFVFVPKTRYEEVSAPWLLMRALRAEPDPDLRYSVRQNVWSEDIRISFARSATKHRISRERSLYVIEHCGIQFIESYWDPPSDVDQRVVFVGDDLEGVALEVIAIEQGEDEFMVIHAMDLRNRFQGLYEEARSWEK
jgi:hypothetical protein